MSIFRNSDIEELKCFILLLFVDSILLSTSSVEKSFINQIMTGLEGNRQIYMYLPREIQDRLPKSFYRNSWGGDPESQGANR